MADDFEKAKKQFIEGMTRYLEYMKPLLSMGHSMRTLGILDTLDSESDTDDALFNADIWDLALTNFLSDVKEAKNKEEVAEAVKKHREFLKRLL